MGVETHAPLASVRPELGLSLSGALPTGEDLAAEFVRRSLHAKILLVDDEKLNSFVVAEYLKAAGYRDLIYTTDPFAALGMVYHQRPDVVLLDLQMPKLNGLDILQQLRSDEIFDRVAVVVLTVSHDEKEMARALELGATDVLHKSLGREEILARIKKVVVDQARQDQERMV